MDAPVAKLLGRYEHELQGIFTEAIEQRVSTFLDIGCADGYYAAGLARASPSTKVYAFDLSSSAREFCGAVARGAGCDDRVVVGRRFGLGSLDGLSTTSMLVLCDIEGAELPLFREPLVTALRGARVVVEVHEFASPGSLEHLHRSFSATHRVRVVQQEWLDSVPQALDGWTASDRALALSESRDSRSLWLDCVPNGS